MKHISTSWRCFRKYRTAAACISLHVMSSWQYEQVCQAKQEHMSNLHAIKLSTQYLEHVMQQPHCIHEEVHAVLFSAASIVCQLATLATVMVNDGHSDAIKETLLPESHYHFCASDIRRQVRTLRVYVELCCFPSHNTISWVTVPLPESQYHFLTYNSWVTPLFPEQYTR